MPARCCNCSTAPPEPPAPRSSPSPPASPASRPSSGGRAGRRPGTGRTGGPGLVRGTRIAECLAEFNERFGRRGMAYGAVVAIVSDGWDTGPPADLATQMARLSRVAYRVVWVNPRTASPRYRPLVAGMAAALPYCDAVVSAHNLASLDDFTAALSAPRRRR
ncbi:VWA domain-containing protein [Streptomyces diastatochromogenes]|nr:VWA domain-containing protein [Streptomyces diastatochromogenes]